MQIRIEPITGEYYYTVTPEDDPEIPPGAWVQFRVRKGELMIDDFRGLGRWDHEDLVETCWDAWAGVPV